MKLINYDKRTNEVKRFVDTDVLHNFNFSGGVRDITDAEYDMYWNKQCWANNRTITDVAPPDEFYTLTKSGWKIDSDAELAVKKSRRHEVRQAIKAKRDAVRFSGVQVGENWFANDDASSIRYLAIAMMPDDVLPANMQWKTLNNSFVPMTKEMAIEIITAGMVVEQTNFMNAERHIEAMKLLDNPLEYDYSDGWIEGYS